MKYLKSLTARKNRWLLALLLAELALLLGRFAVDFRAGKAVDVPPGLIVPYAAECTNDARGARIENYSGLFATTRWLALEPGSYQVAVTYVSSGGTGSVGFRNEIMPDAFYDTATLPAARTRTVFSLWMPTAQSQAQLQFSSDGSGILYITGAQITPTHAWAYVRFLRLAAGLLALDLLLLALARRLPQPAGLRSVSRRYALLALAAVTVLGCLPLGVNTLVQGHDLSIHLTRIEALRAGLLAGQFPVRLDPAMLTGQGYPFRLMYADLLLYPAALLRIAGFSLLSVYRLYVAGITAATALIAWHCLRKMLADARLALLGSALYTLSYYRLTNVYVRSAVGEYSAMAFLPLVVYGLWVLYAAPADAPPRRGAWVPLAVGFSGLLQTHLLSTEMAGLFTALFCLLAARKTFTRRVLVPLLKAAGACLAWNLWFLVPLAQYLALGVCSVGGKYNAAYLYDHAAFVTEVLSMFGAGAGHSNALAAGLPGEMPLAVGAALWLGGALWLLCPLDPALPALAGGTPLGKSRYRLGGWALGLGALALWLSTDSFPWYGVYLHLPAVSGLLGKLQFPWRFLSLGSFLLAAAACAALWLLAKKYPAPARTAAALLLALTLLPAGYLLYSAGQNPALVRNYSLASVDTLAGQVGGGEYLPAALSAENAWVPPAVVPEDGLAAEVVQSGELRLTLALANTAGAGRGVTLPLFFYPGYTARDAAGAALSLANAGGYLRLVVPAGYSGTVTVRFAGFWFWRLADLFSLAAVAFAVWQGQKNRRAARRGA